MYKKLIVPGYKVATATLYRSVFKKMYVGLKVKVGGLHTD